MDKKISWAFIFLTIAINVVMLQWTVESYLGREFEQVVMFSGIGTISAFIALFVYMNWRKAEYGPATDKEVVSKGEGFNE